MKGRIEGNYYTLFLGKPSEGREWKIREEDIRRFEGNEALCAALGVNALRIKEVRKQPPKPKTDNCKGCGVLTDKRAEWMSGVALCGKCNHSINTLLDQLPKCPDCFERFRDKESSEVWKNRVNLARNLQQYINAR